MTQLPEEITESVWYKNLPEANWGRALEKYQEKLAACGVDLETLDKKYFAFLANVMFSWEHSAAELTEYLVSPYVEVRVAACIRFEELQHEGLG